MNMPRAMMKNTSMRVPCGIEASGLGAMGGSIAL